MLKVYGSNLRYIAVELSRLMDGLSYAAESTVREVVMGLAMVQENELPMSTVSKVRMKSRTEEVGARK